MIKLNHQWNKNGDFEQKYLNKIAEKLGWEWDKVNNNFKLKDSTKNITYKHFYICSDNVLDRNKLELLLLGTLEEILQNDDFKLLFEVCEFANYLNKEDLAITNITDKLNSLRTFSKYEELVNLLNHYNDNTINDLKDMLNKIPNTPIAVNQCVEELESKRKNGNNQMSTFYFKNFLEEVSKVMDYDFITDTNWGSNNGKNDKQAFKLRDRILSEINIDVCPYCNRNFIDTFFDKPEDSNGKPSELEVLRSNADLDHFYNKSVYPFLALTLYNFIPSCHICNSRFKTARISDIINPYIDEFGDDCTFRVNHESVEGVLGIQKDSRIYLNINDNVNDDKIGKIQESKKLFKLENVYQTHHRQACELYEKNQRYPKDYLSDIVDIINYNKSNISITEKELEKDIFGISDEEDFKDTPLAKFKSDIYKQIGR